MPDPTALASSGPWAVVVSLGLALGLAFFRGWLIPRVAYDREVMRSDSLAKENAELRATLDSALRELADEVRWDARDRHTLRGERPNA